MFQKEIAQLDNDTANLIRPDAKKWKNKSIFQVLLQYRASRVSRSDQLVVTGIITKIEENITLIIIELQINIFNQNLVHELQKCNEEIDLEKVDPAAKLDSWLGDKKTFGLKTSLQF